MALGDLIRKYLQLEGVGDGIGRIHMLKKIVKEADNIVTTLHNIDASWVVSGVFPVARGGTGLSTIALGGILYASALNVLSRLAPTAANQVLRSTAANALQFAALLAADIPNLDAAKITSGVFALARIPNMDWAHISGLFPRTIAQLLSDHNLANHPLAIIPVMDDAHIPDIETLSYGGAFAVAQIPGLPAAQIISGQFPLSRMPRAASGFLEGKGAGVNPAYSALVEADIPDHMSKSKLAFTANKLLKGAGPDADPTEIDMPTGVPSGIIAMWHGTIANIPSGWVICDGNNGTPNMLGRFVEGVATAATDPGATGGEATHTLTIAEMPAHTHSGILKGGTDYWVGEYSGISYGSTNSTGGGGSHQNKPPYYDVAFLMKT